MTLFFHTHKGDLTEGQSCYCCRGEIRPSCTSQAMLPSPAQCHTPERGVTFATLSHHQDHVGRRASTPHKGKNAFLIKVRLPQPSADNHNYNTKLSARQLTGLHTAGRVARSPRRREGKITNLNKMFNLLIMGQAPRGWKVICNLHYGIPTRPGHKSCQPEADAISPSPLSLLCPCQI